MAPSGGLGIHLTDKCVVLTRKGRSQTFRRDAIATACRDGKHLVLLGHDGGELAREECEVNGGRLADAFTEHGYAWAAADPHKGEFRRWVPGRSRTAGRRQRLPQGPPRGPGEEGAVRR
ncbi:hypothetical protein [Streptomyces sp. NRRL S-1813]|uniref:YqeB family protein n=1 Tax=Streptomyces sp. NRRL S-1813 TaxID=1463888 RepID=UPI00131BA993|nr:hypothetical protein [Streptomyces sp. NRRL S-1813]